MSFNYSLILLTDILVADYLIIDFLVQGKYPKVRFFVFSHIQTMSYFRLGKGRFNECPAGLESLAGARNRRKVTVKSRRNPLLRILPLIRLFFL